MRKDILGQVWKKRSYINIKSIKTLLCRSCFTKIVECPHLLEKRKHTSQLSSYYLSAPNPPLGAPLCYPGLGLCKIHFCFACCSLVDSACMSTREKETARLDQREGTGAHLLFSYQHQRNSSLSKQQQFLPVGTARTACSSSSIHLEPASSYCH